ncbi:MAG: SET domain-containing protein-lysine N-methyltransferase [Parvularculaceae bacterium]
MSEMQNIAAQIYWSQRPNLAAPGLSKRGGRGLFALSDIPPGALIDRACTVEIGEAQTKTLDDIRPVGDYYFAHPENERAGLMAYGLMAFINHAEEPNADVLWKNDRDLGWLADLVSTRAIRAGEEITYRYKCPLWFPARG